MPWVDIFPHLAEIPGAYLSGKGGMQYDSYVDSEREIAPAEADSIYSGEVGTMVAYAPKDTPEIGNTEAGAIVHTFQDGENYYWNDACGAFGVSNESGVSPFVGMRVRVRCGYPAGFGPLGYVTGRLGLCFVDGSGGGWQAMNWTVEPSVMPFEGDSTWSGWEEHTITEDDLDGGAFASFVGLGYVSAGGSELGPPPTFVHEWQVWLDEPDPPDPPPVEDCWTATNCECDDAFPRVTRAALRRRLAIRLGFGATVDNLPPGVTEILNDFLDSAQKQLFTDSITKALFNLERFFTWKLEPGVRFYDLDANVDECTKRWDPRHVTWVGVSECCENWDELACGIPPELYACGPRARPERYEVRQCIEVWPTPGDSQSYLRVKGRFGLAPFTDDAHETTIDPEAIFLHALARAKADRGAPDAANYQADLTRYIGNLISASHHTRTYLPGSRKVEPTPYRVGRTGRW